MGRLKEFKIALKSLPRGVNEFDFSLGKQFFVDMECAEVRDADIKAKLVIDNRGAFYDFTFKVGGELTIVCDRCLDDMKIPIDEEYKLVVKYGEEYDDSSDEILVIPESENSLNVANMLYDTIMLAIPIQHFHPEGECNGEMIRILGEHRAQEESGGEDGGETGLSAKDPRWEALRGLTENNN